MSRLKTAAVVLLVALLAVDILAANALVAADRTVLNAGFVTTTLEEENAYEQAEPIVLDQFPTDELGGDNESPPLPVDPQVIAAEAIDAAYLQSQIEPNIERLYDYLHGRTDELELFVDLEPVKSSIADAVEAELTEAEPVELLETVAGEGQDLTVEAGGFTVDFVRVAEMSEDESVFRDERAELRDSIRERVLDQAVDEAFAQASNDELLALVIDDYDPDAYTEAEKEQMVTDQESEIRTAIRDRIESERGEQIDAEVEQRLAENRETIRSNVTATVNESLADVDPAVAEPVTDLALVAVDGYVADISHDEFSSEFDAAVDDLAAGIATVIEEELDEQAPDRIDLTEELDPSAEQQLEEARRAVGLVDLLTKVLPVVGLVLVGLVYLVSRSVSTTAMGVGVGLAIGGLPTLVGASQIQPRLQSMLGGDLPAGFEALLLGIAGQVTDAIFLQSAVVVGLGVVLFVAGLGLKWGVIERIRGGETN